MRVNRRYYLFLAIMTVLIVVLVGCNALKDVDVDKVVDTLDNLQTTLEDINKSLQEENGGGKDTPEMTADVEGAMKVHFINIGQGNATFIESGDGKTMLYDVGGDGDVGRIVVDYIKGLGYDTIDVVVFTHPHADHINGAPTIFEELKINSVYHPKVTHTTKTFENLVDAVQKAGLKFKTAKAGVEIPLGEAKAVFVAPLSSKYENLNDYSAAVKIIWGSQSILLTGDVEKISEKEMIESGQNLAVDLLLIPHHGSNSSSTQGFLDKTMPQYGIVSSGKDNSYGHPHKEVVQRLKKNNITMYNTAELGSIVAVLDGENIEFIFEKE